MTNPNEVVDGLFLSGRPKRIENVNSVLPATKAIKAIVSIGGGKPQLEDSLHLGVFDKTDSDFLKHFDTSSDFIQARLQKGRTVLVHCMGGLRRSPTFVAAFLVKHRGYSARNAEQLVKEKRPPIRISIEQRKQLEAFEKSLKTKLRRGLSDITFATPCSSLRGFVELDNYLYKLEKLEVLSELWKSAEDLVLPEYTIREVYCRGRIVKAFKLKAPTGVLLISHRELHKNRLTIALAARQEDLVFRRRLQRIFTALLNYKDQELCVVLDTTKLTTVVIFAGNTVRDQSQMERALVEACNILA